MVSKLVVVGWVGWVLVLVAAGLGYGYDAAGALVHLGSGLVACATLALAHLALLVYLAGMRLTIRRAARTAVLDASGGAGYRALTEEALGWLASGLVLTVAVFATGEPAYTGRAEGWEHQVWFIALLVLEPIALLRIGPAVRAGEEMLGELAARLEAPT